MWHGLFYVLGKVARLVTKSMVLGLRQARGQARSVDGRKSGPDGKAFLEGLFGRPENPLSGAALAAAGETGRALLNRPSVRASLEAAALKVLGGAAEQYQSVEDVRERADRIASILQERDIVAARLGVDGLPGSGKSTLARALAEKLGLQWKSLDHENMNVPIDFTQEHVIYEHHRLLRTQDVDPFDAIVYVDEPVAVSKARVLRRSTIEARQGLSTDVLDYDKLETIGRLAFDVCQGESISIPRSGLLMKVRPPGGFRAVENTISRLRAAERDPGDLGKEEMLFLLAYGSPRSGLMAYFLPGAFNEELLTGFLAGMRRYLDE
jgi:hypothetical protein